MATRSLAKVCCILSFLTLASLAWGQRIMEPNASGSWPATWVDHTPNCTYPTAHNCWEAPGGTITQAITAYGSAGGPNTFGTDASGCAYVYSDPLINKGNNAWGTRPYGCGLSFLQSSKTGVYALRGTCSTGHSLSKRGLTSWSVVNAACFKSFSMDKNGSGLVLAIDTNNALQESTNYGVNFTAISGCGGNGGAASVAALTSDQAAVVCNDHSIWNGKADGTAWTGIAGMASQVSGDGNEIWVIGYPDTNVYRWTVGVSTSWDHFYGPTNVGTTWLDYNTRLSAVWALQGSTTNRLTEWAPQITRSVTATTICEGTCPGPNSNPPVYHTLTTQAVLRIKGVVVAAGTVYQSGHVDPTAVVTGLSTIVPDTFITCFFDSADCVLSADNEEYTCSEEGPLGNGGGTPTPPAFKTEYAHSHVRVISGPPFFDGFWDKYPTAPECLNPPPDLNPGAVKTSYLQPDAQTATAFDVSGFCASYNGGPFVCPVKPSGTIADVVYGPHNPDPGPQQCTVGTP